MIEDHHIFLHVQQKSTAALKLTAKRVNIPENDCHFRATSSNREENSRVILTSLFFQGNRVELLVFNPPEHNQKIDRKLTEFRNVAML